MKKTIYLFLALVSLSVYLHSQITITIDDAYSFNRLYNAYIRIEYENKGPEIYKPNKNGIFKLDNITGEISITFYADNYQAIKSQFKIDDKLSINAVLLPNKGYKNEFNADDILTENINNILIEGVVKDIITGEIIENASINFKTINTKLLTDSKGIFYLRKDAILGSSINEGDTISYTIQAKNYKNKTVTYNFSNEKGYAGVFLEPLQKEPIEPAQLIFDNQLKNNIINEITQSQKREINAGCTPLPSTIRVGTNCSCDNCSSVSVMSLEVYVQKGLDEEWFPSWNNESLKSGSLPYRTYGAYHVLHPIRTNYDISNTTCKQVWQSDYYTSCVNAASATQGEYLVSLSGNIVKSEYSAENNGLNAPADQGCGDGYSGTGSSYPCISDNVCTGHDRFGHGRGMCQWGTKRWGSQGKDYQWITDHYYNPANIFRCDTDSNPPPNDECADTIDLISGTSCSYTSGTVDGATQDSGFNDGSCDDYPGTSLAAGVFYEFTAQNSTHTISVIQENVGSVLNGEFFDAVVVAYSGTSCSYLVEIDCNDDQGVGSSSLTLSNLNIGQTYWIRVYDWGSSLPLLANRGFKICITHTGTLLPDAPTQLSPSNGSTTSDNTPYFDWNNPLYAYRYQIQIDDYTSFYTPVRDEDNLDNSNYTPTTLDDDTYYWRVRANNGLGSWGDWSDIWSVIVDAPDPLETVSTPTTPSGPTSGVTGTSYSYSTGGSSSSSGHSIQYRFNWGDGSYSTWSSSTSASHSWSSTGTKSVTAESRCVTHTSIVSSPSGTRSVSISVPSETVSTPTTPSGPTSGVTGTSYSYSTGGSSSSSGHSIQYRFNWGDGSYSTWSSSTSASHSWSSTGTKSVTAESRCATHTSIVSSPSGTRSVSISTPCISGSIIYNTETGKFNFCEDGIWVEK